jgi:hypothetical protein
MQTKLFNGPSRYQWTVVRRLNAYGTPINIVATFRFDSQKLSFEDIKGHYDPNFYHVCIEDYVDLVKYQNVDSLYPNIVTKFEKLPKPR